MDDTDSEGILVTNNDICDYATDDDLKAYEVDELDSVLASEVSWHEELDFALQRDFVDHGIIKSICKCRAIPYTYRPQVWKICLNVTNRSNSMMSWDGKLDMVEQAEVNSACQELVDAICAERSTKDCLESDKQQMTDDAVAVITFYCKCRAVKYHQDNGWISILKQLMRFKLERVDVYNCFYAIQSRFVPRCDISTHVTNAPFHLLRLLLLYHDPELCNFLDTCKITPDIFTDKWFSTLFSANCVPEVTAALWDIYVQRSDCFFIFFLSLVILVNAKEQIMTTGGEGLPDMESTIKVLSSAPSVLTVEDVDDFCQLAAYYSDRTPASFRRDLTGCFYNGAMVASASKVDVLASELAQSFCLKISIPELLLSSQPSYDNETDTGNPQIRYFVVDCRLAQQYNEGHLLTAFHLDATLMLREPAEFDAALHSLFTAQEQAIQAGSVAGGEHLCFIGSGNEEEDQYMYMVVANLLQKRKTYISVARGGYQSLLEYLADVGIDLSEWLVGSDQRKPPDDKTSKESGDHNSHGKSKMESIFRKMAGNVMEKSHNFKEKVAKFMESTDDEWSSPGERSAEGKSRKEAVFSIADDDTEADCDETTTVAPATTKEPQVDALQRWKSRADFRFCFECQAVERDGQLHPGWLLVTDERLYCLVAVKRRGWVRQLRPARLLRACARITSRRSFPELITFKFADPDVMTSGGDEVVAADRYILPHAGDATREIKRLIVDSDQRWQRATSGGDDDVTEAVSS